MGRVTRIAIVVAALAAAGSAWAQPAPGIGVVGPGAVGPGDNGTHHREGEYGGVSPAGTPSPDAKRAVPPAKTLGWIGFHVDDSATEVFLQAARPFTVSQRVEAGQVVVSVAGLSRLGRNTRRPLDTRFFDGPLARIAARVVKARRARRGQPAVTGGVEVRIAFKPGAPIAEGAVRTATEKDGLFYLYLTFAGAAPAATPAD